VERSSRVVSLRVRPAASAAGGGTERGRDRGGLATRGDDRSNGAVSRSAGGK